MHLNNLLSSLQRVEKYEPSLVCIRTVEDNVFGAYCSTAWSQRHFKDEFGNRQTYFGTGETFLFSLRPTVAKYQWVGISRQQDDAALSSVEHSAELFMHADNNMITIGGGWVLESNTSYVAGHTMYLILLWYIEALKFIFPSIVINLKFDIFRDTHCNYSWINFRHF